MNQDSSAYNPQLRCVRQIRLCPVRRPNCPFVEGVLSELDFAILPPATQAPAVLDLQREYCRRLVSIRSMICINHKARLFFYHQSRASLARSWRCTHCPVFAHCPMPTPTSISLQAVRCSSLCPLSRTVPRRCRAQQGKLPQILLRSLSLRAGLKGNKARLGRKTILH